MAGKPQKEFVADMSGADEMAQAANEAQRNQDWILALSLWDACLTEFTSERRAPSWRAQRAWSLLRLGRFEEAEKEFLQCTRVRPSWPTGYVGLAQVARLRKDWLVATQRLEACLEKFPAADGASTWRSWLADCMVALGRHREAESIYRTLAARQPDAPAGWVGLARSAKQRQAWSEAVQHWDECLARFPDPGGWRIARAQALTRGKLWRQAFDAWDILAREDGANEASLIGRARAYLESKGPDREAERLVEELLIAFPASLPGRKLHAEIARFRGDDLEAIDRFFKCVAIDEFDLESYAFAVEAALRAGNISAATIIRDRAPRQLAQTNEFKCRVLLAYYELARNYEIGHKIIDDVDIENTSAASVLRILKYLRAAHDFTRMRQLATIFLGKFPVDARVAGFYLTALRHTESDAVFESEKRRLVAQLPAPDVCDALSLLRPGWLSAAEVKRVIDFELSENRKPRSNFANLAKLAFRRDAEVLGYIADRIAATGGIAGRLLATALLSLVADRERLQFANLRPTAWSDFRRSAQLVASRYATVLAEASTDAVASDSLLDFSLRLQSLIGRCPAVRINTAESYHEAAEFARWLCDRIRRREPTSVLRLCDGEGNFLPYPESFREFQESDQRAIQQTWWGGVRIEGARVEIVMNEFIGAVMRADAVGIPPQMRMAIFLRDRLANPNQRGLASALAFVSQLGADVLDRKVLTSCDINNDLANWDLFRQVFKDLGEISVISCHDLGRVLAERFGLAVRWARRIPAEFAFSSMFSASTGTTKPFYPDVFDELMETVAPERGHVFLIAAGLLGKLICDRIRERGGIAIDIGSVADLWMGHGTRNRDFAEIDFDVASSLIEAQPFRDNFEVANSSALATCRSDRSRRRNLTPAFDRLFEPEEAVRRRPHGVRIIGHPRCGSRYVADVLSCLGQDIGHERPGRAGICSWIHAVDDLNPPYRVPVFSAGAFTATLAYVRNPHAAIPSIMVENCQGESFAYRRFHIARVLRVDIAERRDPLERAVESYLRWMEIVERREPRLVLRVEHLLQDLAANARQLTACGLEIDWAREAEAMALPRDTNSTLLEFPGEKPTILPDRYLSLPLDLRDGLGSFCSRHGYPFPALVP